MGWGSKEDDRLEVGRRAAAHLQAQRDEEFRRKVAREAREQLIEQQRRAAQAEADRKAAAKRQKDADRRDAERQEKARQRALIRSKAGTPAKAYKVPGKRPNSKGFFS